MSKNSIRETKEYKELKRKYDMTRRQAATAARRKRAKDALERIQSGEGVCIELAEEYGFKSTRGLLNAIARITGFSIRNNTSKAPLTPFQTEEDRDAKFNAILTKPII